MLHVGIELTFQCPVQMVVGESIGNKRGYCGDEIVDFNQRISRANMFVLSTALLKKK